MPMPRQCRWSGYLTYLDFSVPVPILKQNSLHFCRSKERTVFCPLQAIIVKNPVQKSSEEVLIFKPRHLLGLSLVIDYEVVFFINDLTLVYKATRGPMTALPVLINI